MVDSPFNWLADDAVYQRTMAGKRELLFSANALSDAEVRLLSMVTGHTPLRTLLDMGSLDANIGPVIRALVERGLIEIAHDSD